MIILIMLNDTELCLYLEKQYCNEQLISDTILAVSIEESQWFPGSFVRDNWN